ncbi:MAG: hypothetical protein CMI02_09655 [Oceanospirillaceae bacterium]|nr:hypothetical protein [Oceanospirillaceae bacterium]
MAPLKAPLLVFGGIVCTGIVIALFASGSGESAPTVTAPATVAEHNAYTPPSWPRLTTYREAEAKCPTPHNECRRVAAVNEWGAMCSTWLQMETSHRFLPQAMGDPNALFNGRLFIRERGVIVLTGTRAAPDEAGFHYHYGCRVDTWNERITGIAVPIRVDQELSFIEFQ